MSKTNPGHFQEMYSIVRKPFSSAERCFQRECQNTNFFAAFSRYVWPLVNTASYPCLILPLVNNLLCSLNRIPDMEIRCKSAKDVLVGLYFLLAMQRMFTSGKNLTQKLDPSVLPRDAFLVWESLHSFIHSFIHLIFAFNKKYNNSIQKYIKDNIRTILQLNY